jgi:RimJ/RimL family protein N-acetyltransferase
LDNDDIRDVWRRTFRIELETPRLLLRPLIAEDVHWLADLFCDSEVCEFLFDGASTLKQARNAADAIVYLDLMKTHFGHWTIQDKSSGEIHGWTELSKLRPWDGLSDEIALSYVLRRQSWGRGIATEAAGRLLKCAFDVQRLERVMAVTMAANLASQRVLAKLGLHFVKRKKSADGISLRYFRIDNPASAGDDEIS